MPTNDPNQSFQDELNLRRNLELLEQFERRVNSSFTSYLDGIQEVEKVQKRINRINADINALLEGGNQINDEVVQTLLAQRKVYQGLVNEQNNYLKNVNLIKLGYQKIETIFMGLTSGMMSALYTSVMDADKAWRELNKDIGLSGSQTALMRTNLIDASVEAAHLGVSFQELTDIQRNYTDQVQTAQVLSEKSLEAILEIGRGTKMGTNEAAKMAGKFSQMGRSIESTKKFYQDSVNESIKFGVAASAVIQKINDNLDRAQMYNFKGGISGLKEMAKYSTKFNLDMKSVFDSMDKTNSIEGVIDSVSQLQVLGGKFAQVDPFKLLYQSRNDAVGYTKTIQGLTDGMVTFNKKTGEFNQINAGDLNRLKLAADATGVSYESLVQTAYKGAQINMIDGMLGSGLNQSQKEFIEGVAQLKDGKFKVEVSPGQFQEVSSLTRDQVNNLMTSNETLKAMAEQSQTFNDVFKNTLDEIKAGLLPILIPLADMIKSLSSSGILKPLMVFGTGVVTLIGLGGFIRKAFEPLSILIPALKNMNFGKIGQMLKIGRGVSPIAEEATRGAANATGQLGQNINSAGSAAGNAWKNMLAFGGAVLMIGGGVFLATKGIASMATAIGALKPEQLDTFKDALIGVGIGFGVFSGILAALAFSGVGEAAIGIMLGFGAATLLFGAGIGIASIGIGIMAKSLGEMFDELKGISDPKILTGLSSLILSLGALGASSILFANPLAWIGLTILTANVSSLAEKLSTLDFASVSTGASSFNKIADAIERINENKLDKLQEVANSLGTLGSIATIFSNFTNMMGDGIKVEFKDQTVPVTIDITTNIDGNVLARTIAPKIPLAIRSSQKGGVPK